MDCLPAGTEIVKGTPSWVHFGTGATEMDIQLTPGKHKLTVAARRRSASHARRTRARRSDNQRRKIDRPPTRFALRRGRLPESKRRACAELPRGRLPDQQPATGSLRKFLIHRQHHRRQTARVQLPTAPPSRTRPHPAETDERVGCSSTSTIGSNASARARHTRARSSGSASAIAYRAGPRRYRLSAAKRRHPSHHSGGIGSSSRSNGIARFCATVMASSSTMRSLTKPKCSTKVSHASLSTMALVGWPKHDDFAFVREVTAPVNEVDEDFGRGQIEADEHGACCRQESANGEPQRPEPAVLLLDVSKNNGVRPHEFY